MLGACLGYLGFKVSMHGALAHRQCCHRTWGLSAIRRSRSVIQAVAHWESHSNPVKSLGVARHAGFWEG